MERIGRYIVLEPIGTGGSATVHLAHMTGPLGFSRTLAVKRLHPHLAADSEVALMLLDEARLSSRIRSPFVVPALDVVAEGRELLIAMEYVLGESLSGLLRTGSSALRIVEPAIACAVVVNLLHGLHAAHELRNDAGEPLGIVHRDVSPQNVIVGADGVARLLDFGVAKALGQLQVTREGTVKGKLAYMAPEQVRAEPLDRRADVFAAAALLWEMLAGRRLFKGDTAEETLANVLRGAVEPLGTLAPVPPEVEAVVRKGLANDRNDRYADALTMAEALESAIRCAPPQRVAEWVASIMGDELDVRRRRVAALDVERFEDVAKEDTRVARLPDDQTGSAQALFETSPSPSPTPGPTSAPPRDEVGRSRAKAVLGGVVLGLVTFGAAGSWIVMRAAPPSASAAALTASPPAVDSAPVPPPPVEVALAAAPAESPPESAPAPAASPSAAGQRAWSKAKGNPPIRKGAAIDCTKTFDLDAQGRRHYRRECLK